jgi:hypothetical protein
VRGGLLCVVFVDPGDLLLDVEQGGVASRAPSCSDNRAASTQPAVSSPTMT